jgi:hypothetical protein
MPDREPPTAGELLRRLDDIASAHERTVARLDSLAQSLEDRYVPRREFDLRVGEVEKDLTSQAGFRRQVAAGFLVGLLLLVMSIVVALSRVPGAGG